MTIVELFAGGGGAALGLHRAGFRSLAACEWDQHAAATLRAAVADGRLTGDVIEGDVRRDWSAYAGADAVWASPPCQAWSTAGKRLGVKDERNGWPWTFNALDAIKPAWFMAENVPGMLCYAGDCTGKNAPNCCPAHYFHGYVLPECERRFASVQWTVIDAADLGVPQRRHRVYLVCGPRPIAWPKATHGDPGELRQLGLFGDGRKPWVSVREALGLGCERVIGGGTRGHGMAEWSPNDVTDSPAATVNAMCSSTAAHYVIGYRRGRDSGAVMECHTSDEPACALRGSAGGSTQPFIVDPRHPPCHPDEPATAVRSGGGGHSAPPMYLQQNGIRRLTVAECQILQAWPSDWPLQGGITAGYKIVGNGCCPPVVEAIGRAVLKSAASASDV